MSLGDGQWGVETTGHDSGFCSLEYGPLVDFVGPHMYRMEYDRIRQHLKAAFICELAAVAKRSVIMGEFGLSSDFDSSQASAAYYRQLLHATLAAGATGWIAWNNTDYDNIKEQWPAAPVVRICYKGPIEPELRKRIVMASNQQDNFMSLYLNFVCLIGTV